MSKKKLWIIISSSVLAFILLFSLGLIGLKNYYSQTFYPGIQAISKKKILIVYAKRSEPLEVLANKLHSKVGGDMLAIKTSSNAKTKTGKYKIIFVGSPVSNLQINSEIEAFLRFNKLDGKIVIPFVVYKNSRDVIVINSLKRIKPKAIFKSGFVSSEKDVRNSDTHMNMWLNFVKVSRWEWR